MPVAVAEGPAPPCRLYRPCQATDGTKAQPRRICLRTLARAMCASLWCAAAPGRIASNGTLTAITVRRRSLRWTGCVNRRSGRPLPWPAMIAHAPPHLRRRSAHQRSRQRSRFGSVIRADGSALVRLRPHAGLGPTRPEAVQAIRHEAGLRRGAVRLAARPAVRQRLRPGWAVRSDSPGIRGNRRRSTALFAPRFRPLRRSRQGESCGPV